MAEQLTATEVDMAKKLYEQEKKVKRLNDKIKQLREWNIILERYLSIPVNQIADIEEFKEKPRNGPNPDCWFPESESKVAAEAVEQDAIPVSKTTTPSTNSKTLK